MHDTLGVTTDYDNTWYLHQPLGVWNTTSPHIPRDYSLHLPTGQLWDNNNEMVYRHTYHNKLYRNMPEKGQRPTNNMIPADGTQTRHGIEVSYDVRGIQQTIQETKILK